MIKEFLKNDNKNIFNEELYKDEKFSKFDSEFLL